MCPGPATPWSPHWRWAWAPGLDPASAAWLANLASGLVVEKVGTAVVHPDEILARVHEQHVLDTDAKVLPRQAALDRIARWRAENARIGFTNGCFDLVHPGHVALLRQARAACDRLVVGLNSDASVRRLKGPGPAGPVGKRRAPSCCRRWRRSTW